MLPVEIIYNPNWWLRNYGIRFDESFYFDLDARIENDVQMRRALYERFGIGTPLSQPRPVIGSEFVAGGFVVPALLSAEIRFAPDQAPCPVRTPMSREEAMALAVPDLETTWPMSRLISDMDRLHQRFGYVTGDFNTDGVLNTAMQLRGEQFLMDLLEDAELVSHLCQVITETQVRVAEYVRARTGTCSLAVNRSIASVDRSIYLHANCSVQMISPALYRRTLLAYDCQLAARLGPYGIHHCGDNLHLFAKSYAPSQAVFYDVGWGSDVTRCAADLPAAFLNLRLSPVRMLQLGPDDIRRDTLALLAAAGRRENVGVCCINMDYGTPDENVRAMFQAAQDFAGGS